MTGASRATAAAFLVVLASAATADARDGDSSGITLLSRLFAGNPHAVLQDGSVALVGLDSGLAAFDLDAPAGPELLGQLTLASPGHGLATVGTITFVANGESGLQVVSTSDPSEMRRLGSLPGDGIRDVAVAGSVAFLAEASAGTGTFGLRTADVADPGLPSELGFSPLSNGSLCVAVSGRHAFVGLGSDETAPDHGLAVVDVIDPRTPTPVHFVPLARPVHDVAIVGSTAYLATGFPLSGSLVTVDVSTPGSAAVLAEHPLPDQALSVSVRSGIAHLAARSLGLVRVDVTDPLSPVEIDRTPTGRDAWAVDADGSRAILGERSSAGRAGLTRLDTPAPPTPPRETGTSSFAEATDAAHWSGAAFLLRRDGLDVVDASDPTMPVVIGRHAPDGADFSSVAVDAGLAAVADGSSVHLLDVTDPTDPTLAGVATLVEGAAVQVELDGSRLYSVNGRGLEILDVSDPASPSPVGFHVAPGWASALAVEDGLGHLAAGSRLQVLDLGGSGDPSLLGEVDAGSPLYGIAVSGDLAVATGLSDTLVTFDVGTPSLPTVRGTLPGESGFDVRLVGDHAVVAAGGSGLLVIDVGVPETPFVDAFYDTSGWATALAADGPLVFLATTGAQHWLLGCETCSPPCTMVAEPTAEPPIACQFTPVALTSELTGLESCAGGEVLYRWLEDGVPIPGAVAAGFVVPPSQPPGDFVFTLEATCRDDPSCFSSRDVPVSILPESWPVLVPDSLRVRKEPPEPGHVLSWEIESGSGPVNVHRTADPWRVSRSGPEPATLLDVTGGTEYATAFDPPPGEVAFYRVFGRRDCSGASQPSD